MSDGITINARITSNRAHGPLQVAVSVRPMADTSVTATAGAGTSVALTIRESVNLIADTLAISHVRAGTICRHLIESAQRLAELTR